MNKEELEKELKEIDEKIRKKGEEIKNSQEFKSLENDSRNLWRNRNDKETEFKRLEDTIYKKYKIDLYPHRLRLETKNIKSSVKAGIKRGLGVKYINLIDDDDIIRIVKQLIMEDFQKVDNKALIFEISKIDEKLKRIDEEKEKLINGVNIFIEKRKEIVDKLYKEGNEKEEIKKKKRDETHKIIEEKLPILMEKIRKEVMKGLVLDNLK